MDITSAQLGDVTVLSLSGNLDATTAEQVAESITSEFGQQHLKLVVDLVGIDFMSSAGLRSILAGAQEARTAGGDLRLAGANKNVKRVLDFSGFTKIMKYFDTVEAAVESFTT